MRDRTLGRTALLAASLLAVPAGLARAAGPQIEIVAADDATVTYRELLPERVALDPSRHVYHVEGCPLAQLGMEWVGPGAATLRGFPAHACAATRRRDRYATKTERRRPRDPTTLAVLFLGNSLTFYNEMPRLLERIAAGESRPIASEAVTLSGASLDQLWERTDALARLWRSHWDYVVVQERGGSAPRERGGLFEQYVARFAAEARRSGAQPLLLMTWDPRHEPENARLFLRVGHAAGARVVPVGTAWHDLIASGAFVRLDWDGTHPDLAGSYLVACSVFAAVYGRSPQGLPSSFAGLGTVGEAYDEALLRERLTAGEARTLQQAAWEAWQRAPR